MSEDFDFLKSFFLFEDWQYILSCRLITSSRLIQFFKMYKQSCSRNCWVSANFNIHDFKHLILLSCSWDCSWNCSQKKIRLSYEIDCNECFSAHNRNVFDYISCRYNYLFITWTYHSVLYFKIKSHNQICRKNYHHEKEFFTCLMNEILVWCFWW